MSMPSIWMIGDIQGCCASLDALLALPDIADDSGAHFWFAGDLVNRGPESLTTLRRIMSLGDRATAVLGNHDLHLLAMAAGVRRSGKKDTLEEVLKAPDAQEIIDWLRSRPLAHCDYGHLLVHAGVLPQWDAEKTLALADEVQTALRSNSWKKHLEQMYGNSPDQWDEGLTGPDRLRVIINALTRLRMCDRQGKMALSIKTEPSAQDKSLVPWFNLPKRATRDVTVVFGHWSTLGLKLDSDVICLDSGCLWGGHLTAVRLQDHAVLQVPCEQMLDPLDD
ncbi:symmetrical bis(5'-nucleosyl)-tetraphosphatase [Zwartia sp.]|uniref:symmetrical bis(5'-nucleosyl)-tetraphosphatase n=1 Tax=Zwartia sp. TaxID=2978004 RepID=UPI002716031B|nr:symmetrical bis(5'-nucleosyl)-tetraphosphatase [Zwartia sp.]MDO9024952.1 symmetrical bis(5'-nucleosyl)-tetraphosphatase [Zwartia sp.]